MTSEILIVFQDMKWSQVSLQCELYLDSDCKDVTYHWVEPSHSQSLLSKTPHPPAQIQEIAGNSSYSLLLFILYYYCIINLSKLFFTISK